MVSVGGREVCWWKLSVIVAAFEPDGDGGREGGEEEETGEGIGRGTWPCVQPTTGGETPPSFTADARRHYNLYRNTLEQPGASTRSLFFIMSGEAISSQTRVVRYIRRDGKAGGQPFDFTRR